MLSCDESLGRDPCQKISSWYLVALLPYLIFKFGLPLLDLGPKDIYAFQVARKAVIVGMH